MTRFHWDPRKEQAARQLALNELTDEQIAAEAGVSRTALDKWKKRPEFAAQVELYLEDWRTKIRCEGLAVKENRVKALAAMAQKLEQITAERAEDLAGETPGGGTGLLVRQVKLVKVYEAPDEESDVIYPTKRVQEVREYVLDQALISEHRSLLKQIAQELGQLTEKQEISGPNGRPIAVTSIPFHLRNDPHALELYHDLLGRLSGEGEPGGAGVRGESGEVALGPASSDAGPTPD